MILCRSHYRKSRKTRAAGWNHMACNVCDELTRLINREPPGSELKRQYEYKLIWHLAYQGTFS